MQMISQEQREQMEYLMQEYKEKKDQMCEIEKDVHSIRDELVKIFKYNKIKQKEYKNILYKINNRNIYIYPHTCKAHAKINTSRDYIVMYNKKYTYIYTL